MDYREILKATLSQNSSLHLNKKLLAQYGIEVAGLISYLIDQEQYYVQKNEEKGVYEEEIEFYCTNNDIRLYTGISNSRISAIKKLGVKEGLFQIERRDVPSKSYYKINHEKIMTVLSTKSSKTDLAYESALGEITQESILDMGVRDLRLVLKKNKIKYSGKDKKDALIAKLQGFYQWTEISSTSGQKKCPLVDAKSVTNQSLYKPIPKKQTSSSEDKNSQKKTVCDFLNKYDLKDKTKIVIQKNFPELTEEIFLKSYNKLKLNPKVHTLEGALIDDLKGEWEEFVIPDDNKKPGNTGGSGDVDIDCLKESISKAKRNLYVSKAWNNQVNFKLKKILAQEGKEFTINLLKRLYESLNYEIKTSLVQYLGGMVNKIKATEDTSEEILPEVPNQDLKTVEEKQTEEIQRLEETRSETQELLEVFENLPEEKKTEVLNATKLKYMTEIGVSVMQPSQEESFNFARNVYIAQVIKEWQGEELLL